MKKTALSLLLVLVLVMSMVLAGCGGTGTGNETTAAPDNQETTAPDNQETTAPVVNIPEAKHTADHCVCGGKYKGDAQHHTCATLTGWTALTAQSLASMETEVTGVDVVDGVTVTLLPAGNYYLAGDLELTNGLSNAEGADVVICLNGFKLTGSSDGDPSVDNLDSADSRIVNQVKGGSLSFTDCSAEETGTLDATGKICAQTATVALIHNENAVLNLYAGTILCGESSKAGAGIRSLAGTQGVFNMYGGTIKSGTAGSYGGNVAIYSPMNMYAGTISGGDGGRGGNLYLGNANSLVTIYGGTLTNGTIAMGLQPNDIWVQAGKLIIVNVDASCQVKTAADGEVDLSQMDSSLTRVDDATVPEGQTASFTLQKAASANP